MWVMGRLGTAYLLYRFVPVGLHLDSFHLLLVDGNNLGKVVCVRGWVRGKKAL